MEVRMTSYEELFGDTSRCLNDSISMKSCNRRSQDWTYPIFDSWSPSYSSSSTDDEQSITTASSLSTDEETSNITNKKKRSFHEMSSCSSSSSQPIVIDLVADAVDEEQQTVPKPIIGSDIPLMEMDLAAKQRQRRQIRMQILRQKRQRKSGNNSSFLRTSLLPSPVMTATQAHATIGVFSPISPIINPSQKETHSFTPLVARGQESQTGALEEEIKDPKLLRKLRNRESAARSRQKLLDLIDSLTCELCDRYVKYQDLEDQFETLNQSSQSFSLQKISQYPSFDALFSLNSLEQQNNFYEPLFTTTTINQGLWEFESNDSFSTTSSNATPPPSSYFAGHEDFSFEQDYEDLFL